MAFRRVAGDLLSKECLGLSDRARCLALQHSWKSEQARPPVPRKADNHVVRGPESMQVSDEIDATARGFGRCSCKDQDRFPPDQWFGTGRQLEFMGSLELTNGALQGWMPPG